LQAINGAAWSLLFGLGIFLFGMSRLEAGLHDFSGARLKRWLMRFTGTPLSSAGFGVGVTALLQSSSMVSLLVLAFASAGLMPLYNGIGVILGANVGTTATGWLVATIGFKLDLEELAIPLFGLGCLSQLLLKPDTRYRALGQMVLGLGLLLFGLSLMKASVAGLPQSLDISVMQGQPPLLYLIVGMLLTALIQSSSATMMLTLTALHAGLINLPAAAALVIGADIGTTSTTLLASLTGSAIKRRLALAHLVFNLTVDFCAFVLLLPLLPQMLWLLQVQDPLYSLVAFHTCFNLIGLCVFLPFLKPYSRWIGKRFQSASGQVSLLERMPTEVPDAALSAMAEEVRQLWMQGVTNNLEHFAVSAGELLPTDHHAWADRLAQHLSSSGWEQRYETLKDREDELMHFALRLQQQPLSTEQAQQLSRLLEMARALVYACKTIKDIHRNLADLQSDDQRVQSRDISAGQFHVQRDFHRQFYQRLMHLILGKHSRDYMREELDSLFALNDAHHQRLDAQLYSGAQTGSDGTQLSTRLNVNREVHHANKSLLHSLSLWAQLHDWQPT